MQFELCSEGFQFYRQGFEFRKQKDAKVASNLQEGVAESFCRKIIVV